MGAAVSTSTPKLERQEKKSNGMAPDAERLLLWLKSNERINAALYSLNMLDVIDKHNTIVTVAAAMMQLRVQTGIPGMFLGPNGTLRLLGPGPGGVPLLQDAGVIDVGRVSLPPNEEIEIHRSPAGFNENLTIEFDIVFGKGPADIPNPSEGQPVLQTVFELYCLTERILEAAARRTL